jgi:hypothetical protein
VNCRILAVCRINLRPAVRMELRQVGWLKQPVAKVRGPIVAGDRESSRSHHCGQAARTAVGSVLVYFLLHSALYTGECVDYTVHGSVLYAVLQHSVPWNRLGPGV